MDLKNLRKSYNKDMIEFNHIPKNPIDLFEFWLKESLEINKNEANACVLSTVSNKGIPSSRVVLLKDLTDNGFVFFTNYNSSKAREISNNKNVALNFYWPELERQVRITGVTKQISEEASDKYFKSRPRSSQIGAWASEQSNVIQFEYSFKDVITDIENRFHEKEVERPHFWGGYCIIPNKVEFWQGRPSRLHDRLVYLLDNGIWKSERLSP